MLYFEAMKSIKDGNKVYKRRWHYYAASKAAAQTRFLGVDGITTPHLRLEHKQGVLGSMVLLSGI